VIAVVQQLTIFDAVPREAFTISDTVEVVMNIEEKDVEDFYYLKSFVGMKGQIVKVIPNLQYEVLFAKSNRIGIFGHGELMVLE
jgi:hypothetical protein